MPDPLSEIEKATLLNDVAASVERRLEPWRRRALVELLLLLPADGVKWSRAEQADWLRAAAALLALPAEVR